MAHRRLFFLIHTKNLFIKTSVYRNRLSCNISRFTENEQIEVTATDFDRELAARHDFVRREAGLYHNTAVVIESDGSIAGKYRKMHIPDDPAYYEKFYFTPGDLGFHPIDTSVGRLGVMVCWDQWYPEAARLMALQGAQMLIYPTAIGYESSDTADEQQRQRTAWTTVTSTLTSLAPCFS